MKNVQTRAWHLWLQIVLGLTICALGFRLCLLPNDIAAGGFTGIAQLINAYTGWPVGVIVLCLNLPLFALSMRQLGMRFVLKSFVAMAALSLLIDLLPVQAITDDGFLAAVYGGVMVGVGLGLILRGGATTGGTDMLATMVSYRFPVLTIGAITFLVDALVIVASGFVFSAHSAMLALIAAYLMNRLLDTVLEGLNNAKAYYIISSKSELIAKRILHEMNRGVTGLDGRGMYSGEPRTILLCVIGRIETMQLRRIVAQVDPSAFMIATNVHEALGEGFQPHR